MDVMPFSMSVDMHSAPSKQHNRNLVLRTSDAMSGEDGRRAEREVASILTHIGGQFDDGVEHSAEVRTSQH